MKARMAWIVLTGALALSRPALAGDPAALPQTPPIDALPRNCPPPSAAALQSPASCAPATGGFGADGTDVELDSEVLLWWTKSSAVPPLITTSLPADLGILGRPSTFVAIGQDFINFEERAGGRLTGRYFLDDGWGIQLGGFWLENGAHTGRATNHPVLAVPITDPSSGAETSLRLAEPGAAVGGARLEMGQRLWGTDVGFVCRLEDAYDLKVDVFGGFRFVQLAESLKLRTVTTVAPGGLFAGSTTLPNSTYTSLDDFNTRNSFYGANVGGRVLTDVGRGVMLQAQAQIAIGSTSITTGIDGASALYSPGLPVTYAQGGNLAQRSNIGRYETKKFTYIPQVGASVGYQVCEHLRLSLGYDFLYMSSVAQPGDQIDKVVNPKFPPIQSNGITDGPSRPTGRFERTDFWAQGVTIGVNIGF